MLVKHIIIFRKEVSKYAYLFFIVLSIISPQDLLAQSAGRNNEHTKDAYFNILALRISEGRRLNNQLKPELTKNPLLIYSDNLADVLELLLTDDLSLYEEKGAKEKKRLDIIADLADSDPYKKFLEAEIKLQWAFIKLKFGDEMSAVWNINQAYKIIKQNESLFPEFLPNKKTLGVLHVILGAVPQKYQWVLKFFFMQGSTDTGVLQLTELSNSSHILSLEGNLLLSLIDTYLFGNETKGINRLQNLQKKNRSSKLISYLLATTFLKTNQAEKALAILTEIGELEKGYLPIIFTDYLMGEIMLQKGDYQKASAYYHLFLKNHKGKNFIKDAYYKLFIVNYLSADAQKANYYLEKAGNFGATITEADKYAQNQITQNVLPNKTLLKIRYATDGGFYLQADSLSKRYGIDDFSNLKDQVEFIYRKARLYDKRALSDTTIIYYQQTIEKSGNNEWYFAPNAALQLGYIFSEMGQNGKAKYYFEKAIAYKNHEYENSISNKAEAGLRKLKKSAEINLKKSK